MSDDTTIILFRQPGSIIDRLTEIARDGARRMLMAALKAEADGFVARFSEDGVECRRGQDRIIGGRRGFASQYRGLCFY